MADSPLVVVAGPTGSGKSDLALRIAEEFSGEVVNCDSIQLYRCFDIGAAKVREGERRGIPHHLIDVLEPTAVFTAGDYSRIARQVLREIAGRGRLPVVAGGTGFYLRALLEGLFAGPSRDETLRERLSQREAQRSGSLHRILSRLDRTAAGRIHPRDVKKTIRALEICLLTRRPVTELFASGRERLEGFRVLKLGLNPPREPLYERINRRAERMFSAGLLDEVRRILAAGVPPTAKPFESVGYREAIEHIEGRVTIEEAICATAQSTRNYAKRQWTWFRRDSDIEWLDGFGDDPAVVEAAINRVAGFLRNEA